MLRFKDIFIRDRRYLPEYITNNGQLEQILESFFNTALFPVAVSSVVVSGGMLACRYATNTSISVSNEWGVVPFASRSVELASRMFSLKSNRYVKAVAAICFLVAVLAVRLKTSIKNLGWVYRIWMKKIKLRE